MKCISEMYIACAISLQNYDNPFKRQFCALQVFNILQSRTPLISFQISMWSLCYSSPPVFGPSDSNRYYYQKHVSGWFVKYF